MKLSFTTLGCPDWSFEKILDEARRMGFPAIEIRGLEGKMLADEIEFFKPGRQQDTKRMLKAHGVEMCAFGSSINFHDPEKLPAMLEEGRRAIDVCQNMGIPHIRVFGDRIPEGRTADEAAQLAADGIRQLCAYADGADVDILLEVHGNFNTIEVMKSLLEKLDDPHFGIYIKENIPLNRSDREGLAACGYPDIKDAELKDLKKKDKDCLLYTSPSPRDS